MSRIRSVRKVSAITVGIVAAVLLAGGGAAYAIGSTANAGHLQEVQQVTVTTPSPTVTSNDTPPAPVGEVNPNAVSNATPPPPIGEVNPNATSAATPPVAER